jgi:hypothetical protein
LFKSEGIGASRSTTQQCERWHPSRQSDSEFAEAWDEIVEQCLDAVEQVVFENALAGKQPVNNIFLLRHRRAHIYGEKVKVEEDRKVNVVVELYRRDDPRLKAMKENVVDAEDAEVVGEE